MRLGPISSRPLNHRLKLPLRVLAYLIATGCDTGGSGATVTPTEMAIERVDRICTEAREAIEAEPTPTSLKSARRYLSKLSLVGEKQLQKLEATEWPEIAERETFNLWLAELESVVELAKKMTAAAARKEGFRVQRLSLEQQRQERGARQAARELGLKVCGAKT